jgi:uncharacterized protein YcbX
MLASGRVTELHRWPVKSMAGQPVDVLHLDERGAAGDRAHALFDGRDPTHPAPRRLTARQSPRMLLWRAAYDGDIDPTAVPQPTLTGPDGRTFAWDDPELPAALEEDLARPVALRRDEGLMQDLGHTLLVTTQATLDAVGEQLGGPLDLRRFRTNAHVVLDDAPAYAEEGWEGRELTIGDAVFGILHPCERCVIPTRDPDSAEKWAELLRWLTRERRGLFGINVRPLGPARIAVGDPVSVQ